MKEPTAIAKLPPKAYGLVFSFRIDLRVSCLASISISSCFVHISVVVVFAAKRTVLFNGVNGR